MNILLSGNKGLIGSELEEMLINHNVTGFDREDYFHNTNNFFNKKYDMIIHCGAHCLIRDVIKNPALAKENIDVTADLLEIARKGNSKFIYFSSSRVAHHENNPYIASKRACEELVKSYKKSYGIDYIIFRPETVWGERDNPKRVIPTWTKAAENGEPLIIYGNKQKELSPIMVDDFCKKAYALIMDNHKYLCSTIHISGQIMKAERVAEIIIELTGSDSKIIHKPAEATQPQFCIQADITSGRTFYNDFKKYIGAE
ncbi:MAG TPA: SDR family oxidoreductase [Allocoleopsis sp.]